jgi:hypothetical protein
MVLGPERYCEALTLWFMFNSEYGENKITVQPNKPPPGLKASFDLKEASAKVRPLHSRIRTDKGKTNRAADGKTGKQTNGRRKEGRQEREGWL